MPKTDDHVHMWWWISVVGSRNLCIRRVLLWLCVCQTCILVWLLYLYVVLKVLREPGEIAQLYRDQCHFPSVCRADVGPVITSRYGGQYSNIHTGANYTVHGGWWKSVWWKWLHWSTGLMSNYLMSIREESHKHLEVFFYKTDQYCIVSINKSNYLSSNLSPNTLYKIGCSDIYSGV